MYTCTQYKTNQSNQNNLDERKAVWEGLDRTLTEAGSNDDMITELEFTEALSGLSKDTAPGPDRVKYSDIKNLSVHNKSELFRLYKENFATWQVPEDWSHSYLKPIPKPGKTKAERERKRDKTDIRYETSCVQGGSVRKDKNTEDGDGSDCDEGSNMLHFNTEDGDFKYRLCDYCEIQVGGGENLVRDV